MKRARVMALLAILLVACSSAAPQSESPPLQSPVVLPSVAPIPGQGVVDDRATIVQAVQPRWSPGNAGIGMTDDWAEHAAVLEPPVPVSVLDGPTEVDGADWYRVYVLPDAMRWPSDFVA